MSRKLILIVEDDRSLRRLMEYHLGQAGYDVTLAENGVQGVRAAQGRKPDLVLLDVMMPGELDGFGVCRELRADRKLDDVPVIFLTARSGGADKLHAFELGADDYLVKPFANDELKARVAAVLARVERVRAVGQAARPGRVVALFGTKGGAGTTTLAVNLAAAAAERGQQPVTLVDLALPLGSVGLTLGLTPAHTLTDLLALPVSEVTLERIDQHAVRHTAGLNVLAGPRALAGLTRLPSPAALQRMLQLLVEAGHLVIVDAGSTLTEIALTALRQAGRVVLVTSGQPVAAQLHQAFLDAAGRLGLESSRLLTVVNQTNGPAAESAGLASAVARIPAAVPGGLRLPAVAEVNRVLAAAIA